MIREVRCLPNKRYLKLFALRVEPEDHVAGPASSSMEPTLQQSALLTAADAFAARYGLPIAAAARADPAQSAVALVAPPLAADTATGTGVCAIGDFTEFERRKKRRSPAYGRRQSFRLTVRQAKQAVLAELLRFHHVFMYRFQWDRAERDARRAAVSSWLREQVFVAVMQHAATRDRQWQLRRQQAVWERHRDLWERMFLSYWSGGIYFRFARSFDVCVSRALLWDTDSPWSLSELAMPNEYFRFNARVDKIMRELTLLDSTSVAYTGVVR
jgi:hypothetical protein